MEYVKADILRTSGEKLWVTDSNVLSHLDLKLNIAKEGEYSFVQVSNVYEVNDGAALLLEKNGAVLLNLGQGNRCVVVENKSEENPDAITAAARQRGDVAFLKSCQREGLPDEIISLGKDFLNRIREFSTDDLVEGLNRKWVTKPKNFLAITIQNRNRQFCVHVKKSLVLNSLQPVIDVRDDRPGYARFWLQNQSQLDASVAAAKGSFGV